MLRERNLPSVCETLGKCLTHLASVSLSPCMLVVSGIRFRDSSFRIQISDSGLRIQGVERGFFSPLLVSNRIQASGSGVRTDTANIYNKYSKVPSIQPLCTRGCFTMT